MTNPLSNSSGMTEATTALQSLDQTFWALVTIKCTKTIQESLGWVTTTWKIC